MAPHRRWLIAACVLLALSASALAAKVRQAHACLSRAAAQGLRAVCAAQEEERAETSSEVAVRQAPGAPAPLQVRLALLLCALARSVVQLLAVCSTVRAQGAANTRRMRMRMHGARLTQCRAARERAGVAELQGQEELRH
jgi:hypothetical protein